MDYQKIQSRLDEIETKMQSDEPVDDDTASRLFIEGAVLLSRVMVDIAASLDALAAVMYELKRNG